MARPKRVYPNRLPDYKLLHSEKIKMRSGVYLTALYIVKKTAQYFISLECWASCCGIFKTKIKNFKLRVDLPTLTDENAIKFLKEECWLDWVDRELKDNNTVIKEALEFLDKTFPNKKKVFFYELRSLLSAYCFGSFIRYDENGNVEKRSEHDLTQLKYYINKYHFNTGLEIPKIKKLYNAFHKLVDKVKGKESDAAYKKYYDAKCEYLMQHHDLSNVFIKIGESGIVCPYAFSDPSVKGSVYEHAGEIYMVMTGDTIYFEIERHY